jgi:diaminopimelate epimerase
LAATNPIAIEPDAGVKQVRLALDGTRVTAATVDMGEPILDGRAIPAGADGHIIGYQIGIAGRQQQITAVSMGNPHCVVFVKDDAVFNLSDSEFAALGRPFESHPFFPRRVNTEFVLPVSRERLKVRVFERGSGETLACGTGACAALVAAVLNGHSERRATVELRGGSLEIEWRASGPEANHVFMTGEAVQVFRGTIEVDDSELITAPGQGGGLQQ